MKIETVIYTLPAFFASALINDDHTGLTDSDETALNDWLDSKIAQYGELFHCFDFQEVGYGFDHQITRLYCDMGEFHFHVKEQISCANTK